MTDLTKTLNAGAVSNPSKWITAQLAAAAEFGFPFSVLVTLDTKLAEELLRRNLRNRPIRERRAMRYRDDMQSGRWRTNGEALVVSSDGAMISGQHRCIAVQGTDLAIPTFISLGVEPDADLTVDQGQPKSASDFMAMRGTENSGTLAKIVRLRMAYEAHEGAALNDVSKATNGAVIEYFEQHNADVERSAQWALEMREYTKPLAAPGVFGFVHNVLHDRDGEACDVYMTQVAKGEDLHEGNPAYAVRSRLLAMGRIGAARKAEAMFAGWNAYKAGRQMRRVQITGRLPALL